MRKTERAIAGVLLKSTLATVPNVPTADSSASKIANYAVIKSAKTPVIIYSTSTDYFIKGYTFRGFRYVIIIVLLYFLGVLYDLYFDIEYTISLIDRKFLLKVFPDALIKKISISITIKGIGDKKYNVSEYVRLKMWLLGGTATTLIERELYIINNLTIKALINIDIIKLKEITINLEKDIIKINTYKGLKIPVIVTIRGLNQVNITVYSYK